MHFMRLDHTEEAQAMIAPNVDVLREEAMRNVAFIKREVWEMEDVD